MSPLGIPGIAENVDMEKIELSGVDVGERDGALSVVGAAQPWPEGTTGVEPTGEAERAMATKSDALVPWVQVRS